MLFSVFIRASYSKLRVFPEKFTAERYYLYREARKDDRIGAAGVFID
jgi:hypothetical protein